MRTYRSKSKLVESSREYLIQTDNDVSQNVVSSSVFIDGVLAERVDFPHPEQYGTEEVESLVRSTHESKKRELEGLLKVYREVKEKGHAEILYHLGAVFSLKGFHREAEELLSAVVAMRPDHHQAYNQLSVVALDLDKCPEAIKAAEAAVESRPQYADYRNNLGNAYLAGERCPDAVAQFREALRINLYYGDAYYNLGLALIYNAIKQQDAGLFADVISKSVDCFRKAVLINSDYNRSVFEEAVHLLRAADLGAAYARFRSVRDDLRKKRRREQAAYHMKFVLHPEWISEKLVDERMRFLENELSRNRGYVDLYPELSRCYFEKARILWEKGIQQYRLAIEINPSLSSIGGHLSEAEKGYGIIRETLVRIAEKG